MRKIASLFLLFISGLLLNAQSVLKVEYEELVDVEKTIPKSIPEELRKQLLEDAKKNKKYVLYYSGGNSYYTNNAKLETKEVQKNVNQVDEHKRIVNSSEVFYVPIRFYHRKGEKGVYNYQNIIGDEYYAYEEPKWTSIEYKDEIQRIDVFDCKLVEMVSANGYVFRVWYTEKLPVSAGPLIFYSLPGLVLKVEAPNYTLYATKVSNDAIPSDVEVPNPKLKVYKGEELRKKNEELSKPRVIRKEIRM